MSRAVVQSLVFVHQDDRRTINEVNGTDYSVQYFKINSKPDPRGLGNHYHTRKKEIFIITSGGGKVLLQDVTKEGLGDGALEVRELTVGSIVNVPPFVAHTFHLAADSEMACWSSERFNEADKDMPQFPLKMPTETQPTESPQQQTLAV